MLRNSAPGGGVTFAAWDVSGARRHRALWERHYARTDAVIFVVDAADPLRLVVARDELELLVAHPDLAARRVPLLVLANKVPYSKLSRTIGSILWRPEKTAASFLFITSAPQ